MRERKNEKDKQMAKNLMTRTTYERLKIQLEELREKAKKAWRDVGEAAGPSHNWHDNFPFEQARGDSEIYTSQVARLQQKLAFVEIIEPNGNTQNVGIGNTVVLQFSDRKDPERLTILGPDDFNEKLGWISYATPIAKAILNKKPGENIIFQPPQGERIEIKILSILPGEFE